MTCNRSTWRDFTHKNAVNMGPLQPDTNRKEVKKRSRKSLPYKMGKGFTLIEFLTVILIIGILTAAALPRYNKLIRKTKYETYKLMVRNVANAQRIYYLENGDYADKFNKLDIILPTPRSAWSQAGNYYYRYPWGDLIIDHKQAIGFVNTSFKLRYTFYFHHTVVGKQECLANINDTIGQEICKEDSGLNTHSRQYMLEYVYTWWQ